jgi:hypothetical protein
MGCQSPLHRQEPHYSDPALPMSLNRTELIDYLNSQNQGLQGWRCTSTSLQVRMPNGLTQRLTGNTACQAPQYFRLTAHNVIATTDIGSNASRCWFYARPGDPAVITWRHEDTSLLSRIPSGIPYIDPNWLMLVLGVKPLNEGDYELSKAPAGTPELWLTAIEDNPNGGPMRRVIKVDTIRGVIREHALYDSEANPLVRAELSQHRSCGGVIIPNRVKLLFPQLDWELLLRFDGVETNPHLPDELWRVPEHNMQVVDLGEVIRGQLAAAQAAAKSQENSSANTRVRLQPPVFSQPVQTAFTSDSATNDGLTGIAEPEWDSPGAPEAFENPTAARQAPSSVMSQSPRRRLWPWLRSK